MRLQTMIAKWTRWHRSAIAIPHCHRRSLGVGAVALFLGVFACLETAAAKDPVLIGLDAEFGHKTSTSAQAVQLGMEIAIDEINREGGVLGGRPIQLVTTDNKSIPAYGVDNLRELAAKKDLVAVFGGKFSPVVLEWIPVAQVLKLPIFATWSSADPITDNQPKGNYVFRLSLKDAWAAPALLRFARDQKKASNVGVMLPNTGWGRSNQAALQRAASDLGIQIVAERWYNWGDKSVIGLYKELADAGAQAIVLIANEVEGAILIREVAALPESERLPILSHWGVTGGALAEMVGDSMQKIDFSVIQTYSFIGAKSPAAKRVLATLNSHYGIASPEKIVSPVGLAHAYDLTHLLSRAITKAGSTDRAKIRDALEALSPYDGLVRRYDRPFSPDRHDALSAEQVFMARYDAQGALIPISWGRKP
jgi:branched-chain amino acid transport system substrate-binding protein